MMPYPQDEIRSISRRAILKNIALAPLMLRAASLRGLEFSTETPGTHSNSSSSLPFSDIRLKPHYPSQSPLSDVLRLVPPGSDEYITEKYAAEIEAILRQWSQDLKASSNNHTALAKALDQSIEGSDFVSSKESNTRSAYGIDIVKRKFGNDTIRGRDRLVQGLKTWLGDLTQIETAEFEIFGIEQVENTPLRVRVDIRYDIVGDRRHEQR